ncbi:MULTISPECIES: ATP-binding protein [Helcococcus]|uniref:ATP-binding protein n=1 Tax=Helcococcus bovis TaxID=3153252 RepID=A0ABW9F7H2_9FIRM
MFEINSGKIAKAQKVVIYGVEGIGKSSLASKFPDALFIDLEGSTNNMNVRRIETPSSWSIFLQQLEWLKKEKPCKTVVIDTADFLEEYLCKPHVVSTIPNGKNGFVKNIEDYGYGAGYKHLADVWGKDFLNRASDLVNAGLNVVILAHATQRKVDLPDEMNSYDRYELKLEKKTSSLTKEWADLLLFLNFKTDVITIKDGMSTKRKGQGQKRMMYTTHHASYDAKNRNDLKDEYELNYDFISHIFDDKKEEVFYRNEDNKTFKVKKDDEINKIIEDTEKQLPPGVGAKEISEEEFKMLNDDERERIPFEEVKEKESLNELENLKNEKLKQLLKANNITVFQIKRAISKKGYFPENIDINDLPNDFVEQVLIAAFAQIKKYIEENNL